MRLVFDTNVLIDGFQDDFSSQARLIDAVRDGELEAMLTAALEKEYRFILRKLIENRRYRDRINEFLDSAQKVEPKPVAVVIDDHEDIKFLEAAVGGQADLLVTADRHLLDVGNIGQTEIVTPSEAWHRFEDESGSSGQWMDFVKGLGIGESKRRDDE